MTKKVTRNAQNNYREIAEFIYRDKPDKADEYFDLVTQLFLGLPDFVTYKRASKNLPKAVREMPVKGFSGYTLRVMHY